MKVTRRPTTTIPGVGDLPGAAAGAEAATPTSGCAVNDRVQLSEAARLRQRLKAEIGDAAAIDVEKVAALRDRLAAGTYAPDPRAVAERLLGELARDLLG
ncbi:MAG: flagellar biosynthesis anti-sigma factor FlgM [Polyangiaceae bacterium UTPRO1]|jgi:flagellar biosynthesis anti-sigma factor FlgM|nr:flagellar biosynthesis anti-sigma factor FlgM [Myxococcales bacterium]OQY66319.1 MAG: flagellar biosynthesis anti-sigma factor FlgM [Polyangiaceae bacterium UTPRO1]